MTATVLMPDRVAGLRHVDRVLREDHRVVVGEGDAAAAELPRPPRRSPRARRASASVSISRLLEMSQFWQNLQPRLQPAVPNESTRRARQKMVQRLLLDRVDAEAARAAVGGEHHLVVLARADEAEAALSLVQLAKPGTDVALHAAVIQLVPVFGRHDRRIGKWHVLPPWQMQEYDYRKFEVI